jgi:putative CocE/NonD family hydrolase
MRDGITLAADVFLPEGEIRPTPTVLVRTPYNRTKPQHHLLGLFFASRGYSVVVVDCRGRFDSDGDFGFFFATEGDDGHDTLDWIVGQPWSNGRVGTTGMSFEGANQQAMALTKHPALKTQIVLDAGMNYYTHTMRESGAFVQGIVAPYVIWMARHGKEAANDPAVAAALQDALMDAKPWLDELPWKQGRSPVRMAPSYEDWFLKLADGVRHDYWDNTMPVAEPLIESDYPDIPVLYATGWYGHHLWANFRRMELLAHHKTPKVLLVGTWMHTAEFSQERIAGDVDFGNVATAVLDDFRLRWFDRYLKDESDPAPFDEPRIQYIRMGGGAGTISAGGKLQHGAQWAATDEWPPPGTRAQEYGIQADAGSIAEGAVTAASERTFPSRKADPVPTIGGAHAGSSPARAGYLVGGAMDQRGRTDLRSCRNDLPLATRDDVVALTSTPLAEAVEITGPIYVDLWLTADARACDVAVKIVDEYPPSAAHPEGYALNLVDTIVRFASWTSAMPVTGEDEPVKVTVGPLHTSNVFEAGHRIRVDVAGSNSPFYDLNPEAPDVVHTTIHSSPDRPSSVRLPIATVS